MQRESHSRSDDLVSDGKTMPILEADLSGTKYNVVHKAVKESGFFANNEHTANTFLIWNDQLVSAEKVADLKPYQRINHFVGMYEICRKDTLARNMLKLAKAIPEEYDFVPTTWILPADMMSLMSYYRELKAAKKVKYFIVKPSNGAQGNGIWITKNLEKLFPNPANPDRQFDGFVVQEYIDKPFLIDGYKSDLRIYALVTSCDPLRVFLYSDGLVRFATEEYKPPSHDNATKLYMHLTNYAVNKNNASYSRGDSAGFHGSKRSLRFLTAYLRKIDIDVSHLWRRITDLIVKTIIAVEPHLLFHYRSYRPGSSPLSDSVCFEVLGFDIILDDKLKPWLLEVNRSPSLGTDTEIDKKLKLNLIKDTINLLNIRTTDRAALSTVEKAQAQRRLLRPSRRSETDISSLVNRHSEVEDLQTSLYKLRVEAAREDYENRHCGFYRRVFPPADIFSKQRFGKLLVSTFHALMPSRSPMLLREIEQTYLNGMREEEILDRLRELNVLKGGNDDGYTPAQAHLYNLLAQKFSDLDEDEDDDTHENSDDIIIERKPLKTRSGYKPRQPIGSRSSQAVVRSVQEAVPPLNTKSRCSTANSNHSALTSTSSAPSTSSQQSELNNQFAQACLEGLRAIRIRFPGKTETETDAVLLEITDNWAEYRAAVASYWLVRLDHTRRRRLLDIVKSNVWAVVQQVWNCEQADMQPIGRTFQRLFNRLLWNNGQGLWNTFSAFNRSNWESIFSYSTYSISQVELNCCRRVVQLCRDCLLIVYKFADEARQANTGGSLKAVFSSNKSTPPSSSLSTNPGSAPRHHMSPRVPLISVSSRSAVTASTQNRPMRLNITGGIGDHSIPLSQA